MSRLKMTRFSKAGLSPGSVVHVGTRKVEKVTIEVIDYTEKKLAERTLERVEESFPFKESPTVTWINVVGLHDPSVIEAIGTHFDIHPLVLEDIANTNQRPKIEQFDDYLFAVVRMLSYQKEFQAEQVSIIVGDNFVISFQERQGDIFDTLRTRIREGKGKIRKMKSDYLFYAILDVIVDHYFSILERIGEHIEEVEESLTKNPHVQVLNIIHSLRRELIEIRRAVWPLREVVGALDRSESKLINKSLSPYLRDLYDHTIRVIDTVESFRDLASGLLDLYLSIVSNRMNEVMKVLTIFAAIFIPLTFIAGVYGMNFIYMPELHTRWGYFAVLGVMLAVAVAMLGYFKKKKWL